MHKPAPWNGIEEQKIMLLELRTPAPQGFSPAMMLRTLASPRIDVPFHALRLLKLRVPDDGMELEGLHDIEYNSVDRILVFLEHLFDLRRIVPHDNTPFLVDLDAP